MKKFIPKIQAEYYISQNPPIDDFLYSKNNCDVVLITGDSGKRAISVLELWKFFEG